MDRAARPPDRAGPAEAGEGLRQLRGHGASGSPRRSASACARSRSCLERLRPGERLLRRVSAICRRGATRASALLTPARGIALLILASALCLVVSQFVTYSSVEIGQPAYAGLTSAAPPTVAGETAGAAHSYVLVPLALLAGLVAR